MQHNETTFSVDALPRAKAGLAVFVLAMAAFAMLTTEFIIVGLLPALSRDMNISITAAGQLVTLFAFVVMLFSPFLTAMLSHFERKKLFIGILLIFVISNFLAAMATNYWMLACARILAALALPVFWGTASETAAQLAGPGRSSQAVARVYLGVTGALVFGIPLGTLAGDALGWRGSFWLIGALCLIAVLMLMIFMPKSHPVNQLKEGEKQTVILKDWRFLLHVLLSVVVFTSMFTAYTYLADILERIAGIPTAHIGWWLMGFGVVGMAGNHYAGRLVERGAVGATLFLLAVLSVGVILSILFAGNSMLLVIPLSLWGVAYTALFPVCQIRVMQAGSKAQALAGTLNVSAANGGIGLGALFGGLGIQHLSLSSLGWVSALFALLAALLCLLLSRLK